MIVSNITEVKKGMTGSGLLIENDGYVSLDMKENRLIKESLENGGNLNDLPNPFVVSAVFQKFGVQNANGRIYPENILKREVEKYQQAIRERRAYGEANHPESSSIDLSRIAMNIIELHWQGRTLVGKMEIPVSEGFRKYGIVSTCADTVAQWLVSGLKIGVSSRGLGSVKQEFGKLIVNDDFEIVCWDVVSQPSTPGAYIGETEEELTPYMESTVNDDEKLISEDKFSKFDKWLND